MTIEQGPHYYRQRVLASAVLGAVASAWLVTVLNRHPSVLKWFYPPAGDYVRTFWRPGEAAWAGGVAGVVAYLLIVAARFSRPTSASDRPALADPVVAPSALADRFVWLAVNAALATIVGGVCGSALALLLLIHHRPVGVLSGMNSQMAEWLRAGGTYGAAVGLVCGLGRFWFFRSILGAMAGAALCGLVVLGLWWAVHGGPAVERYIVAVVAGAVVGAILCPRWVHPKQL